MLIVGSYMLLKNKTAVVLQVWPKKDFKLVNCYNTKTHLWYMDNNKFYLPSAEYINGKDGLDAVLGEIVHAESLQLCPNSLQPHGL